MLRQVLADAGLLCGMSTVTLPESVVGACFVMWSATSALRCPVDG